MRATISWSPCEDDWGKKWNNYQVFFWKSRLELSTKITIIKGLQSKQMRKGSSKQNHAGLNSSRRELFVHRSHTKVLIYKHPWVYSGKRLLWKNLENKIIRLGITNPPPHTHTQILFNENGGILGRIWFALLKKQKINTSYLFLLNMK